jgi:ribosomal subunit interface protein
MQINITGRKINIGEALTSHIEDRLTAGASKYFSRSIDAAVTIGKEGHAFKVDCHLHAPPGLNIRSHAEASDVYAAFDAAADKLEKQLRRYKRRIKNHHTASVRTGSEPSAAQAYVLAPEDGAESDQAGDDRLQPAIIAETRTEIPVVDVGDAVMLMDLSDSSALMFRNAGNNELNVVYRRSDGNIGWIDPHSIKGSA